MNLELFESFGQNYPEEFDGELDCISLAVTCAFNKLGTLLAVGCNDGRIVIWDFLTRGIAKIICAHVHPVCSLSWNRSGYKLLGASTDNTVCIWDVVSGDCIHRYRFPTPVLKVQFHPRNENLFLVCLMKHAPLLMNIKSSHSIVPLDESDLCTVLTFDRKGEHIYVGNAKGKISVLSVPDLNVVASFKVMTGACNTTSIKSIEFAQKGNCFLVNAADRAVRVYECKQVLECGKDGEPKIMQKFQDLVNKTVWKKCVFSGDGEYICAGSARQHSLYIWENTIKNPVKILHGRKGEILLDVVWHPFRPIITSISSGVVSVWAQHQVENWSAFAPDFKELDENVEYDEQESEFDEYDEDKSLLVCPENNDKEEDVDVVTVDQISAFYSGDSDEDDGDTNVLLYLPIAPEIDEPEEGWGPEIVPEEPITNKSNGTNENLLGSKKKRAKANTNSQLTKVNEKSHRKKSGKSRPYNKSSIRSKSGDHRGWRSSAY